MIVNAESKGLIAYCQVISPVYFVTTGFNPLQIEN